MPSRPALTVPLDGVDLDEADPLKEIVEVVLVNARVAAVGVLPALPREPTLHASAVTPLGWLDITLGR